VSNATGSFATDIALIDATLESIGQARIGVPHALDSGRNHNYRVQTSSAPLCVRIHRHTRTRQRIELGLSALQHAGQRGIPVAAPLSAHGQVLFEFEERITSVYPWVEAKSHERFALDRGDAVVLAALHGRLMRAMATFKHPDLMPATELHWDSERSLAELGQLAAALDRDGVHGFDEAELFDDIAVQRRHIESGAYAQPSDFDWVPRQPIHGDIHEGNVLLAHDRTVAAVIDWDMVGLAPPLYEVIRSLDFTHVLDDPAALDGYVAAFASQSPFSVGHAAAMVDLWATSTIHNTWSLRTLLFEGDRRVAPFIPAHRHRIRQFTDPAFRGWLVGRLAAHAV
jgi:Ser/Thr protein kinase RdoA (MazF antagonist)